MSEGQILKPDKDFSKEVDKQLPEAEQLAQVHENDTPVYTDLAEADSNAEKCPSCHREAHSVGEANKTGELGIHHSHPPPC
jgi:hypothetical protein